MHIIYLSGGSVRNRDWIKQVKENFDKFSTGDILYYDRWQTGDKNINFETETNKLIELVKDKKDYCIFAKSIGSILTLKNIYEKNINPQKLIICGHPYNLAKELGLPIDNYLKSLSIPATFIQNEFDPVFSFADLEKVLKLNNVQTYSTTKITGNITHDYDNFNQLIEITKNF